jgi:hypothetical protein
VAKKIDTSNLTVDYKQLMRMTVQDRVGLAKSGLGEELMQSLTPTQLALAFPKYYARQLPDIGRVITGGGAAPTYGGGTAPSYGGGRPSQTAAPVPSAPSGRQNPQSSSTAKENQQNEFLNEIRRQVQERQQQETNQQTGLRIVKAIDAGRGYTKVEYSNGRVEIRRGDFGWRNNNPGNIEAGSFADKYGAIPGGGRYALFPTVEAGNRARQALLFENNSYKNLTILEAIKRWAPPGPPDFNDYVSYAKKFADAAGVSVNTRMSELSQEQRDAAMRSQAISEGVKPGKTEVIKEGTDVQKPEQERPSQSGMTTGLRTAGKTKDEELDIIPPSVLNMRVKLDNGKTATIRELGITKFSELTEKGGQAFSGGRNERNTTVLAGEIQQFFGDKFGRVTAQNDKYHHGLNYKSGHTQGNKLDFTLNGIKYSDAHKMLSEYLSNKYGMVEGKHFKIISKSHGTGPHIDFELTSLGQNVIQSNSPFSASKEIQYPSNYDSWPKPLQDYLKRNPDIEKEIFNAHALGVPVLDAFNKAYESNPKIFEQSSEATADLVKTITNTPPGELPNLEQYLETGKQLSSLIEPKAVDDITKLPAANRFSRTGLDPYSMQKDIVSVKTAAGPARLHKDAAAAFTSAIQDLKDEGFPVSKLGSLNIRQKRWSSSWSEHSYGNAIDIDDRLGWTKEQLKWIKDNPGKLDQILNRYGLNRPMPDNTQEEARKSGRRYDPNHIEYRGAVTPEGLARIQEKKQKYQEYLEQKGINTKTIVTSPPPDTQTQQGQAPVPAEAVAVPSPQKLESQNPTGQQGQGGGVAPPRQGVPAAPQAPQAAPAAPQAVPAAQAAPQAPQAVPAPQAPPVATAVPVPPQENVPSKNAYGGRETTTENVGFFDTETGKTLGTMKRGEVATVNRSGIVDLTPQQRIGEVAQLRPEFNQQPQQEQPQQQSNQPVASMTPSTQMTQTQPNIYNDTNQIYREMVESIHNMPGSMRKAFDLVRLKDLGGKTAFNTLT